MSLWEENIGNKTFSINTLTQELSRGILFFLKQQKY
jgi:hypothetical protein